MPSRPPRGEISIDDRRAALAANAIFRNLQPAELDQLAAHAIVRNFARGGVVLRRGDPGRGMLLILRGRMRVSSMLEDGRESTLGILGPGETLGEMSLFDGQERSADVTAMEDAAAMLIERAQFLRLLRGSPDLCIRVIELLSARLRRTNAALSETAFLDLTDRLGKLLLRLAKDCGVPTPANAPVGTRIELKLSQRDLGALVGGSREKVNKQLRQWEGEGAIAKEGGYLVILRPDVLEPKGERG